MGKKCTGSKITAYNDGRLPGCEVSSRESSSKRQYRPACIGGVGISGCASIELCMQLSDARKSDDTERVAVLEASLKESKE